VLVRSFLIGLLAALGLIVALFAVDGPGGALGIGRRGGPLALGLLGGLRRAEGAGRGPGPCLGRALRAASWAL
jgi:hypothetical protein